MKTLIAALLIALAIVGGALIMRDRQVSAAQAPTLTAPATVSSPAISCSWPLSPQGTCRTDPIDLLGFALERDGLAFSSAWCVADYDGSTTLINFPLVLEAAQEYNDGPATKAAGDNCVGD